MSIILAIDFGEKRSGIAITDESKIFAFGLKAIETKDLISFITEYYKNHSVEKLVIGLPLDLKGNLNEIEGNIQNFISKLKNEIPKIIIERIDERFTSKMAEMSMIKSVNKKKDRQNKFLVDEISATLILQTYLNKK